MVYYKGIGYVGLVKYIYAHVGIVLASLYVEKAINKITIIFYFHP